MACIYIYLTWLYQPDHLIVSLRVGYVIVRPDRQVYNPALSEEKDVEDWGDAASALAKPNYLQRNQAYFSNDYTTILFIFE